MARLVLHSMWVDFICEHTLYLNQDSQLNIINPKIYTHMLAGSSIVRIRCVTLRGARVVNFFAALAPELNGKLSLYSKHSTS